MVNSKYADISKVGDNLVDIDAIIDSIDNIIKTRVGERPFNRDFGSKIEDYLFKPLSFSIGRLILSELIACISRWEKRVEVIALSNVTLRPDTRSYEVILQLTIKGLNQNVELRRNLIAKG